MSETIFCRLCLVSMEKYQELDGELLGIIEELLQNTRIKNTENSAVCVSCVTKVEKAFEFKSTCFNTKYTLSHYVDSKKNAKVDLKMIYLVEKKPGKKVFSYENMKICRTCLNMIEESGPGGGPYMFLLNYIKMNNLENMFKIYIPELILTMTESPLICKKCIGNLQHYSDFISKFLETEIRTKNYCQPKNHEGTVLDLTNDVDSSKEITQENDDTSMDFCGNSDRKLVVEEHKKSIMKMVIKEDIDLFYREKPDFGSEDDEYEECENKRYQGNIHNMQLSSKKVNTPSYNGEYKIFGFNEIETSFKVDSYPDEYPEILGPEKWFNSGTNLLKPRTILPIPRTTLPKPETILPKPDPKMDKINCLELKDKTDEQKVSKSVTQRKSRRNVKKSANGSRKSVKDSRKSKMGGGKSKKVNRKSKIAAGSIKDTGKCKKVVRKSQMNAGSKKNAIKGKKVVGKSKKAIRKAIMTGKKCRSVYGVDNKEMWCNQCKWKKACTKFRVDPRVKPS